MTRSRDLADSADKDITGTLTVDAAIVQGDIAVTGTVDGIDIATRDAILTSTTTTAGAALPKAGGALTGAVTTNSTFDGVDIATRDAVLTSTTTTAGAALPKAGGALTGAVTTNSTFDGRDVATDGTKLDGIESSSTADQTDAEIRAAVEAASDSNVFTDADHNKLNAIEASADVTDATNVIAAGALMDSELTNIAAIKALDQGLATTDEVAFDNTSLNAIAKDISDTAVDIFVYDTSKDSDGGAWRKRTQNTSWYNEAASATRSSRKDFPAVAVIVGEANEVTIYDGDDPDMPMWMVLTVANGTWLKHSGSGGLKALAALNGMLVTGGDIRGAIVNFIADNGDTFETGHNYQHSGVITRNSGAGASTGSIRIVNNTVNDVAMTVLPNAPIDYVTGLPVPTIALATNGGVTVIKDNGTVVDITIPNTYTKAYEIDFTYDNKILYTMDNTNDARSARVDSIPAADFVVTTNQLQQGSGEEMYNGADFGYANGNLAINLPSGGGNISEVIGANLNERVLSMPRGITKIAANPAGPSTGMTNFIASDYSTGWMVGNIKVATLSDTVATNITGSELLTGFVNGSTYAYDTLSTSGSTISSAITDGSNFAGASSNAMSLTAGEQYTVSFSLTINSGAALTYVLFAQDQSGGGSLGLGNFLVNIGTGNHSLTFTAPSTGTYHLTLQAGNGVTTNFTTGAVSVRLAEKDRSINGKGLQAFGTITKTAVETGAHLVAYSGFSSSNQLKQPYNSGLDFDLGDFSMCFWTNNPSSATEYVLDRADTNGNYRIAIYMTGANSGTVNLYTVDGSSGSSATAAIIGTPNKWAQVWLNRVGNLHEIWVNGIKKVSTSLGVRDVSSGNGQAKLCIGSRYGNSNHNTGKLALVRISATIPSQEHILKSYNDEKRLFQPNAKASFYGNSDAVTALAYDDSTDLLHVGTSAGRSVFQGLQRVGNSTTAVGAAISASNSLVAEE